MLSHQTGSTLIVPYKTKIPQFELVCFSPKKYSELNTLQKTKSPVKITNYNTSAASSGKEDIIILNKTRISPITSTEIDFPYLSELTATGTLPDLSVLEKLAAEQLVTYQGRGCKDLCSKNSTYTISGCAQKARSNHQRSNYFSQTPSLGKPTYKCWS